MIKRPFYLQQGKHNYYIAALPDVEWTYSYSAKKFEKELNRLFAGKKLRAIYVDLDGYLEALSSHTNYIDLSYMGGTSLVAFEKTVLQLAIHAEGMIEYRLFPVWEMNLRKVFAYPPDDMVMADNYFYNVLEHDISFDYTDEELLRIDVKGTSTWPFSQPGFDKTAAVLASKKNDLPAEITLHMGSCIIRFLGSDLEYYVVIFDPPCKAMS